MKLYTKTGDNGMTSLMNGIQVSKTDDRIELLGTLDELSADIGLAKAAVKESEKKKLSAIQQELIKMMAGIADPGNSDYRIKEEHISYLEKEIDEIETAFPRETQFVLYGGCEISARLDVARAATRKAERRFRKASMHYETDLNAMKYINRLSDYFYIMARYEDYKAKEMPKNGDI